MGDVMKIVVEGLESEKRRRFAKVEEESESESEKRRRFAEVEEEIESAKRSIYSKFKSSFQDGNQTSARSKMKLELRNAIARKIFTGEEIKGEGDVPIEVALVDDVTGDVVVDEPEASAKVEFFLLNAAGGDDWTAEEFDASIVPQEEGKKPILAGNAALQLQRGVAVVKNIKIRNHASKIKPPEFKLGARVVGASVCIKEAKTDAFTLKIYRGKYFRKHKNPSLSDDVSRLIRIWKGGQIYKRLKENKICTVEDFLIQLRINPEHLKSIVKSRANWEAIVRNAQACLSTERVYCYIDPSQKTGIVFNILGDVLGLFLGGCYSRTSTLQSEKEKADAEKLLASAYKNWGQVKAFDDQNDLQQHLAGLSPYTDRNGASEVVGVSSSSIQLDVPSLSWNSIMNVLGDQTGAVQEFVPSTTGGFFSGADEFIHNTFCQDRGLMDADEGSDATSEVVVGGRKRWNILFYVLKFRKRVALDVSPMTPIRKRQRVG